MEGGTGALSLKLQTRNDEDGSTGHSDSTMSPQRPVLTAQLADPDQRSQFSNLEFHIADF
jgi:hypothetical protein